MKIINKLKLVVVLCFLSTVAFAQNAQVKFTLSPGVFTPEDEVNLDVDVSGTSLAGKDIYLWAFVDGVGDATTNTSFGNSPTSAKFTKLSTDKWRYTFIGTDLFAKGSSELVDKPFGFLVKTQNGNAQSDDYRPAKFAPIVFTPTFFRNFPIRVSQNDPVTIYIDQRYTTTTDNQRFIPATINIKLVDANGITVGTEKTGLAVKKETDGSFSYSFMPEVLFTIPAGKEVAKVIYSFTGTARDANGAPINYTTENGEVVYLTLK